MLNRIKSLFNIRRCVGNLTTNEKIENLFDSLQNEIITIEFGSDLIQFADSAIKLVWDLREQIKDECGFIMPAVKIKNNDIIQENEFRIYVIDKLAETRYVIPTEENLTEELYDGLKTVVYSNLDTVFTIEVTEKYINTVKKKNDLLVWNVMYILSVIDIKTILSDIISYGKSINNINYIFEKIGEQVLSDGIQQCSLKKYNPHTISGAIVKYINK